MITLSKEVKVNLESFQEAARAIFSNDVASQHRFDEMGESQMKAMVAAGIDLQDNGTLADILRLYGLLIITARVLEKDEHLPRTESYIVSMVVNLLPLLQKGQNAGLL